MGVEYFPCNRCKETVCDSWYFYRCLQCRRSYCVECGEKLKKTYQTPEDLIDELSKYQIYKCCHCDEKSRITIVRAKIKKLNKELNRLECSMLGIY
jgi:hypothetical protein